MKKQKKEGLKQRLDTETLDPKDRLYLVKISIIKPSVYMTILLPILIASIYYNNRLLKFSHIMFNNASLSMFLIVLYYTFLCLGLVLASIAITLATFSYRKKNDIKLFKIGNFYDLFAFFINVIAIIYFVLVFMFTPCVVSGPSMNDTLQDGDRLVLWDWNAGYYKDDIVVFSGEKYLNDDIMVIKRVVARAGDSLSYDFDSGSFYVNGEFVQNITSNAYYNITNSGITTIVPKGKLIVFGDNKNNSLDSRSFGMIDSTDVYGKAILRLFPFDKICVLN